MRNLLHTLAAALLLTASLPAFATVFATVHGVVHDPQHRPIAGATVTLQAADSDFALHATTDADGTASSADTVTPTTLITQQTIEETPGADRTIGTEMITDYVPGAYMTHDMLHMRGGHQTSWLIDGVAIPNTKIASNVGPQIDPKDIDSMEGQRGSYDADLGDRTYGMFNVLPRNGFEFNRDGELCSTPVTSIRAKRRLRSAITRRRRRGTRARRGRGRITGWPRRLRPSITTRRIPRAGSCP
jgi:hypothetical protein